MLRVHLQHEKAVLFLNICIRWLATVLIFVKHLSSRLGLPYGPRDAGWIAFEVNGRSVTDAQRISLAPPRSMPQYWPGCGSIRLEEQ